MSEPIHEFPEAIELTRDEYRAQHAALEATLDLLDRFPDTDPERQRSSPRRGSPPDPVAADLAVPR